MLTPIICFENVNTDSTAHTPRDWEKFIIHLMRFVERVDRLPSWFQNVLKEQRRETEF